LPHASPFVGRPGGQIPQRHDPTPPLRLQEQVKLA
jgi:hypothetical protein